MGRAILAVILGYVVMFLVVFLTFSGAYLAMGTEAAFQPGKYEPSTLWLVVSFILGFIAAIAGGCTCVWIAKNTKAALGLAGLVLVLGLAMAGAIMMEPPDARPATRTGDVPNLEAMQNARTPLWVAFVNPFLGAVGVLLGARLKGQPSA
jgi:uncharacterized membrane protein YedE/YeeE